MLGGILKFSFSSRVMVVLLFFVVLLHFQAAVADVSRVSIFSFNSRSPRILPARQPDTRAFVRSPFRDEEERY